MRLLRFGCASSIAASAIASSPHVYAQTPAQSAASPSDADTRAVAETLFFTGRGLMEAGRISEACEKFAESYRLDPAACVNCFAENTGSLQTFATTQQNCMQNTAYPLAAGGANTTLLASRFPFATNTDGSPATDEFYLPSTYERRSILHARVLLNPQDKTDTLDFFCAYLQTPLLLATLPYPGVYSNGTAYADMQGGKNGWRDEQNLQAQRAIAWVQKIAGHGPAIVAGDWHTSTHYPLTSMPTMGAPWTIGDQSPEVAQQFTSAFTAAHVSGWDYPCTFCPSASAGPGTPNPYNPPPQTMWVEGYDFNTTYVSGTGFGSVTEEEPLFTTDSVVYDPSKPNQMGPLSEFYGRRVRIIRPQSSLQ